MTLDVISIAKRISGTLDEAAQQGFLVLVGEHARLPECRHRWPTSVSAARNASLRMAGGSAETSSPTVRDHHGPSRFWSTEASTSAGSAGSVCLLQATWPSGRTRTAPLSLIP